MTNAVTDTLIPTAVSVVIGDTTYTISKFSMAKTAQATRYLYAALAAAGIDATLTDLETQIVPEDTAFWSKVLQMIPKFLDDAPKELCRLLGLILTSNKQLRLMVDDEQDLDVEFEKVGREIWFEETLDTVLRVISTGISQMSDTAVMDSVKKLADGWINQKFSTVTQP